MGFSGEAMATAGIDPATLSGAYHCYFPCFYVADGMDRRWVSDLLTQPWSYGWEKMEENEDSELIGAVDAK